MIVKELVALLGIKTDDKGQKKAEKGMNKVISLAKLAVAAFAAIKAVKWLSGVIQEVTTLGDQFDKMSKKTGVATRTLQELEHAAILSGGSLGDIDTGLKKLQASQVEAADGVATYADEFKRMGIEVKDANGELKPTTDLLIEIADGMQGLDTDAERTAVAMKLLGRAGVTLIPMLKEGSGALREMMNEMHDLGAIMDDELIQSSADYIDGQRRMGMAMRGIKNAIAKDMLPQINKLTSGFIKWWKVNGQVIRQRIGVFFSKFGRVIVKNIKFFAGLLRTVVSFVRELSPLEKKIFGVGVAITALGALIMAGPIGKFLLLIAIIALLVEDFQTWKEGGKSAIGAIMAKFGDFLGMDLTYDQWISDMGLFADGASAIFGGLIGGMTESFMSVIDLISDAWDDPLEAWREFNKRQLSISQEYLAKIQEGFDLLGIDFDVSLQGMKDAFSRIWSSLVTWFDINVIQAISTDITNFVNWFQKVIDPFGIFFKKAGAVLKQGGPKVSGAKALAGDGGITGPGAATSTSTSRVTSKTDIKIDIKAAPGMSEEKMGWEVGRQVSKALEKDHRTAMRALTPERAT